MLTADYLYRYNNGTLPKDLTDKETVLLDKIETSPYRNEVKKYISGVQDKVSETQRQIYADKNRKYVEERRLIDEYRNDPTIYRNSQQFKAQFQMELSTIHKEIFVMDDCTSKTGELSPPRRDTNDP